MDDSYREKPIYHPMHYTATPPPIVLLDTVSKWIKKDKIEDYKKLMGELKDKLNGPKKAILASKNNAITAKPASSKGINQIKSKSGSKLLFKIGKKKKNKTKKSKKMKKEWNDLEEGLRTRHTANCPGQCIFLVTDVSRNHSISDANYKFVTKSKTPGGGSTITSRWRHCAEPNCNHPLWLRDTPILVCKWCKCTIWCSWLCVCRNHQQHQLICNDLKEWRAKNIAKYGWK